MTIQTLRPLILSSALLVLASACSTGRTMREDVSDPAYMKGDRTPVYAKQYTDTSQAIGATIAAGLESRGYYSKNVIQGKIMRKIAGDPLGLPCAGCVFSASATTGDNEQPLKGQTDSEGRFSIAVKPDKAYRISPSSPRYRLSPESGKDLRAGEEAIITFEAN